MQTKKKKKKRNWKNTSQGKALMSERRVALVSLAFSKCMDDFDKEPELKSVLNEEIAEAMLGILKSWMSRETCHKLGIKR